MILTKELKNFVFDLDGSLSLFSDLSLSLKRFKENRPPQWLKFVAYLFPAGPREKNGILNLTQLISSSGIGLLGE